MTVPCPAPAPLRVLVVDDDPVFRKVLSGVLGRIDGVELVGVAPDLSVARSKLNLGSVDVVTIDVNLRGESGLELLPWLRANHPKTVSILLTAGTNKGARTDVDALMLGAAALLLKPSGPGAPEQLHQSLARVLAGVAQGLKPRRNSASALDVAARRELIAVGASTGGPMVVLQFLEQLPAWVTQPVVLVQHMPTVHVPHFAELLSQRTSRRVVIPRDGDTLQRAHVYVAGEGKHLEIVRQGAQLVARLHDGPEEHHCKPAVDPLFRSVAKSCGAACVGVVMTGMGTDGAVGAAALRECGAPVVVQDEASSVVWGMPRAAFEANAAAAVVPGDQLAAVVARWTFPEN